MTAGRQAELWYTLWEVQGALGKDSSLSANTCSQFHNQISAWALWHAGHQDNGTKFFMVMFNVNIRLSSTFITSAPLGSQTAEEATGE